MISNDVIANTHNSIATLLPLTRNVVVYKQSISYLHVQINTLYKSFQTFENRNLNQAEIHKFQKFIGLATQFSNILTYLQYYLVNSVLIFPLENIFYKIDRLHKYIVKLSIILSIKDSNINFDDRLNIKNQISDLQHIKIVLTNILKSGSLISNFPDIECILSFRLDFINTYLEKNYNEVNSILSSLNISSSIPNSEIKQIQKELATIKSINIQINDLQISKKIDTGYFSSLYLSIHKATGELLMIKEVNSDQMTKRIWSSLYSKFLRLYHIKHPFIQEIVGVHFCEPYRIITRFISGRSLFELIHNSSNCNTACTENFSSSKQSKITLSDSNLTKIAYQIAVGMMFLHSNGIVHCDLNSSNILIDDSGDVKITDFGLSGMAYSYYNINENDIYAYKHNSYRLVGKFGDANYIAPEIMENKKIGPKSDVYSYGIILWEMVMKQIPFDGMSYHSIYDYVVSKNRRLPISVPISDGLIKLINSCLNSNPNDRPNFSEIIDIFKKEKISFELVSLSQMNEDAALLDKETLDSSILLDYDYIEKILKDPSSDKFPLLIKFLINNMANEVHEMIRSFFSLSKSSISVLDSSSFTKLFLSFASCLNFDSLVLLASRILNPEEFPSFVQICGMNMIHCLSSFSSVSLLASFAEFFSVIPDNCFNLISDYIPQLIRQIFHPTTLTKISLSSSKIDSDIVFYILHFISRLDHSKYLKNYKMQIYLFFNCEMIESINKQIDIDAFSRILPLIDEFMTNDQINSIIQILRKDLVIPFTVYEFLLKKANKEGINKTILILLRTALKRDIESSLFDLLHILTIDDFECLLTDIDEVFEILQIMIIEKISLKNAFFVFLQLSKLSSIRNYILNTFQFPILNLILDFDHLVDMKFYIFSELYSNEIFCSEMQKNKITTRITNLILKSNKDANEPVIKGILSFIHALSSHQTGCQLLKDEDLLHPFSQMFFLASSKDLSLLLKILINLSNARLEIPQPSLIVTCLMHDLLKSENEIQSTLIALCNIIGLSSSSCVQEIDLQYSIIPLLSTDVDPKIIILALQLFTACDILTLKNLFVKIAEKISVLLASSLTGPDIVLSSISVLNAISSQFDLKPYLEQLKLIQLIDELVISLKEEFPKIADQLLNLKNRLEG